MMEADELIKSRRSIRRFLKKRVDRELIIEIVELCRWAPSTGDSQVVRYTIVDDELTILKLAEQGCNHFIYNVKTLNEAQGVVVLSYVRELNQNVEMVESSKTNMWEVFDAGIACQTFCLAAYAKGIGSCVMGMFNEDSIGALVGLPKNECVAALIIYGYADGHPQPTIRFDADELLRFV